jgi:hypothetical protein
MKNKMNFCIASDDKHLPLLFNLIGSIFKHNENDIGEIMIYNLGLSDNNIDKINNIKYTNVYEVEKINPYIIEDLQTDTHRKVKGLFSWKPVIIKHAIDIHENVLYLDSGTTILKCLKNLFEHIEQNGYLFFDCGHSIKWMTTDNIIKKFNLESNENSWILNDNTFGIDAGFQGISRKIKESFIDPMYELSKDINNFIDNGSCPNGWGTGRHDQTLYSILARKLNFKIQYHDIEAEKCNLFINNEKIPFKITHSSINLNLETNIYRSRWNISNNDYNHYTSFIKLK